PYWVAGAAHSADDVGHAAIVDRLAQPPDMHIDRALVDIDRLAPDIVEQVGAREDAAGMPHHKFKQAEFGRPQPDLVLAAIDAVGFAVEHDLADLENAGQNLGLGAAQERAHAGDQFGRGEGFDEVVVGASRETAHTVALFAARG